MIDGPASAGEETLFWKQRAKFIKDEFEASVEEHHRIVIAEFETNSKASDISSGETDFNHIFQEIQKPKTL